jgi:hypothetical protein
MGDPTTHHWVSSNQAKELLRHSMGDPLPVLHMPTDTVADHRSLSQLTKATTAK